MQAQRLSTRLHFEARIEYDDGYGNRYGEWERQFSRWAELRLRPGSEAVTAARLEGRQPVSVTLRADPQTRSIGSDWRAVDQHGTIYAITSPAALDPVDRASVMLMMESGVAA